jgi:ribonucleoside-diphosphate reductase alpha chain
LASLNLTRFWNFETQRFDVPAYRHAIRLWTVVLEISVLMAQFPSKAIAQKSYDYRTLGLGYANLGALLMVSGIPYDSKEALAWTGALTCIMHMGAYATSAEMARELGAFSRFDANRQPMLRVLRNHRRAAYNERAEEYEDLSVTPQGIERQYCPDYLLHAAREDADRAVELGEKYGYRNAQVTVLAPTGTIGLVMDCDTTGIEPDFALVKFKKLAGGGYFKIVNQSVPEALAHLGYNPAQVADIVAYVSGTNTFTGAPYLTRSMLIEKGLTESEIGKAEKALPGVFDASQALSPWVIGSHAFERLGLKPEQYNKAGFNLLKHFGLTSKQCDELNDVVIGRMTIEGAPHLKAEHYPVFDCANRCGKHGKRYLQPISHVRMMAAAQPFLSGAISKTVNLPNDANVDDVADIYHEGWKLGLKAIALYRDGCKASQPLNTSSTDEEEVKTEAKKAEAVIEKTSKAGAEMAPVLEAPMKKRADGLTPPASVRHRLPKRRRGFTQEARIGGHKVFLRTGEYEDSQLGEIFIDMHKEGAAFRSLMNCFAIAVSMGLQHGVPLSAYVEQFTFTRFEPSGIVEGHPNIKFATSLVDYIFRVLGVEYLKRYDFAQVPPEEEQVELQSPTDVIAVARMPGQATPSLPPDGYVAPAQVELAFAGREEAAPSTKAKTALDQQLENMMGDAPMCDGCGHITVRNGACYKCLNCGASLGCS